MVDKFFYAEKHAFSSSQSAIKKILSDFYGIESPLLSYTENGKPILENGKIHFSVTHTDELFFLAFSDEEIGVDAEVITRKVNYSPILKKIHPTFHKKINSNEDFLKVWTVLESAVKYLGGTIAHDLKEFSIKNNALYYRNQPFAPTVSTQIFENHFVTVCAKCFNNATFVKLS